MNIRSWILISFCVSAFQAATASDALLARLEPQGYVNDLAGVFEVSARGSLENYLVSVKTQVGAEIVVVTLPSLEGGEINDFASRLFEKWKIGKEDRGVLLLTALEERDVRIEVGYRLEGALPDAKTGRILDEEVIPFFKESRYADGLTHGAVALALVAAREAGVNLTSAAPAEISMSLTGAPPASAATDTGIPAGGIGALVFVGFFILVIFLIAKFAKKGGGKPSGSGPGIRSSSGGGGSSGGSSSRSTGGGFSGFGGGRSGGGGASRSW